MAILSLGGRSQTRVAHTDRGAGKVGVHQTNSELHDKFVEMSGGFIADETAAIEAAAER